MDFLKENQEYIIWDFCLDNEFKNRRTGCAFVIDVYEKEPQLSIYIVKQRLSKTQPCPLQPPKEMLMRALTEQGVNLNIDCIYDVNDEIRQWIKDNLPED